ncbi:MAG: hypothetical protein ABI850_11330 [Flavobacterium sp.]
MKIQQKTTSMLFLVIGISFSILNIITSCDKGDVDYLLTTHFVYKNLTSENVSIMLFDKANSNFDNYLIEPKKEIIISLIQEGGKTGVGMPFGFKKHYAAKVIIRFETSNKCLTDYKNIFDPRLYDNFSKDMYNSSNNTLIYNIDKEELDLATLCL